MTQSNAQSFKINSRIRYFYSRILYFTALSLFLSFTFPSNTTYNSIAKKLYNSQKKIDNNDYAAAKEEIDDALDLYKKGELDNDSLYLNLILQKSIALNLLRETDSAIYYLNLIIDKTLQTNNYVLLNKAYTNLGMMLNKVQKYDLALECFRKNYHHIRTLKQTLSNKRRLSIVHFNLGLTYKNLKQYNIARAHLDTCIFVANKINFNNILPDCYGLKGEILYQEKNIDWEKEILKAISVSKKLNNINSRLRGYLTLAEFYLNDNNLSNSRKFLDSTRILLLNNNDPFFELKFFELSYKNAKQKKDYKNSLILFENYTKAKHKLDSLNNIREVMMFNNKNKFYEKELAFSKQKTKYQRERTILVSLLFGLISILMLLFFVFFARSKINYFNELLFKLNSQRVILNSVELLEEDSNTTIDLYYDILKTIENKKLYLNSDLNINDVAFELNSNIKYISAAINSNSNNNFNSLINEYRISYAKYLIIEKTELLFNEIAFQSGFNSVQNFYKVFKEKTGLTPKAFKEISKNQ